MPSVVPNNDHQSSNPVHLNTADEGNNLQSAKPPDPQAVKTHNTVIKVLGEKKAPLPKEFKVPRSAISSPTAAEQATPKTHWFREVTSSVIKYLKSRFSNRGQTTISRPFNVEQKYSLANYKIDNQKEEFLKNDLKLAEEQLKSLMHNLNNPEGEQLELSPSYPSDLLELNEYIENLAEIISQESEPVKDLASIKKDIQALEVDNHIITEDAELKEMSKPIKPKKIMNETELIARANEFYEKHKVEKTPFIFTNECSTAPEIMDEFLSKNQGFCIGEEHSHKAPKDFLVANMELLKEKGVQVLFMEQFYDDLQSDLDNYALTGGFSQNLENNINNANHSYGYKEVVIAARRAGIRVVGIDSRVANIDDDITRNKVMNYTAYKVIKTEMAKLDEEKYVILAGSNHMSTVHEGIPGIADILKCPRWIVADQSWFSPPRTVINSDDCSKYISRRAFGSVGTDALTIQ